MLINRFLFQVRVNFRLHCQDGSKYLSFLTPCAFDILTPLSVELIKEYSSVSKLNAFRLANRGSNTNTYPVLLNCAYFLCNANILPNHSP